MASIQEFRDYALGHMMEVEAIISEVCASRCEGRSGYVLFDGGAHKAYHTLRMLALDGCEQVYAVEADPFMAEECLKAIRLKAPESGAKLEFVQKALQDREHVREISWGSSTSHVGRSSIVKDDAERKTIWGNNPDMKYRDKMTVPATTVDAIVAGEARELPFLKLDLEGADLIALFGARATLNSKRPVVAFENSIHAPSVHGFSIEDAAAYFTAIGYTPVDFAGEAMTPASWFGFFEAWAVPSEDLEWLQARLRLAVRSRLEQTQ